MSLRLRILIILISFAGVSAAVVAVATTLEARDALAARITSAANDAAHRVSREVETALLDAVTALDRQLVHEEVFEYLLIPDEEGMESEYAAATNRVSSFLSRFRTSCPTFQDVICLQDDHIFAVSVIQGRPSPFASGSVDPVLVAVPPAVTHPEAAEGIAIAGDVTSSALASIAVIEHPAYEGRMLAVRVDSTIAGEQSFSLVGLIRWRTIAALLPDIKIAGAPQGAQGVASDSLGDGWLTAAVDARTGWRVEVFIDSDIAFQPVTSLITTSGLILLGVIVIAFGVSSFIARWIADPITEEMESRNRKLAEANDEMQRSLADRTAALKEAEDARADLTRQLNIVSEQQETITALSVPAIRVWDRILMVPLIGAIDGKRAQTIMEALLQRIVDTRSRVVLMDVTGVDHVDTSTAFHFIKVARATQLMGAEFILTGVTPATARSLINLDVHFSFTTDQILEDGLRVALDKLGYRVFRDDQRMRRRPRTGAGGARSSPTGRPQ